METAVPPARTTFVSYSRKDVYAAEQLVRALTKVGASVWWDLDKLGPDQEWSTSIDEAIRNKDCFVLLASKAAFESKNVRHEIEEALRAKRLIHIVKVARCVPPSNLQTFPVYDLRAGPTRVATTIIQGPEGRLARTTRTFLALIVGPTAALFATLSMTLSALILLMITLAWLAASVGPLSDETFRSLLFGWSMRYQYYGLWSSVFFLALSTAMATCAYALVRRNWRASYLLPVALYYLVLWLESRELIILGTKYEAIQADMLSRFCAAIGEIAGVLGLLGTPTVVLLATSGGVLRQSLTGCGSSVARFLPLVRSHGLLVVTFFALIDKVPTGWFADALPKFFPETSHKPTFSITSDPPDRGLHLALERALVALGMRSSHSAEAERTLVLVTNANVRTLTPPSEGERTPSYVIGTSVRIDQDDELLRRYQWIDFRNQAIGVADLGRVLGQEPEFPIPPPLPVSPTLFRAPLDVVGELLFARVLGVTFLAVALGQLVHVTILGPLDAARVATAVLCCIPLFRLHRAVASRCVPLHVVARIRRSILIFCLTFSLFTALDGHLHWIIRLSMTIIGLSTLLPFSTLIRSTTNESWFPGQRLRDAPESETATHPYLLQIANAAVIILLVAVSGPI